MAKLKAVRKKTAKNSTPKSKPSQVTEYWDREFHDAGYRGLLVKVKSRKGSLLEVFVVDRATGTVEGDGKKPHKVDLDDGGVVWSEAPSTAQLVGNKDKARYGLLFLSSGWVESKAIVMDGPNDPPKIPKLVSL